MSGATSSGRRVLVGLVFSLALSSRGGAQEADRATMPPTGGGDTFIVGWQLDQAAGQSVRHGGSLDWVRTTAGGTVFTAGGASYGSGPARWTLGRVSSFLRPRHRTSVLAGATVGSGELSGSPFHHRSVRSDLFVALHPRITALGGGEYLWGSGARGHLVRAGSIVQLATTTAVDVRYASSAGGTLDTRFVVGRLDVQARSLSAFGGVAVGRTMPEVIDPVLAPGAAVQHLHQAFVGINAPVSNNRVTIVLDHLALATLRRYTLTASVAVPVP